MTLPPDKLFQQRLESFSKNPPPQAWDRIEADLNKKKSNRGWMMIAASFLVVIVAATMIYFKSPDAVEIAEKSNTPVKPLHEINKIPQVEEKQVSTTNDQNATAEIQTESTHPQNIVVSTSKKTISYSLPKQIRNKKTEENLTSEEAKAVITHDATNKMTIEEPNSIATTDLILETNATSGNEQKPSGRKITYSAKDVHIRFLKEKQSITLSPNGKPDTGIEKIFDLTYSLKNGKTSIGHLRRLKNDFISNTFNNQKNENQ